MVQNAGLELFFKKLSNSPKNEFDGTSFVLELANTDKKENIERIESVCDGDSLMLNFLCVDERNVCQVCNSDGEELGTLATYTDFIADLCKEGTLNIVKAEAKNVIPISKRKKGSKKAVVFAKIYVSYEQSEKQIEAHDEEQVEVHPEMQTEIQPEVKPEPEPTSDINPQPEPEPASDINPQPQPESHSELQTHPEVQEEVSVTVHPEVQEEVSATVQPQAEEFPVRNTLDSVKCEIKQIIDEGIWDTTENLKIGNVDSRPVVAALGKAMNVLRSNRITDFVVQKYVFENVIMQFDRMQKYVEGMNEKVLADEKKMAEFTNATAEFSELKNEIYHLTGKIDTYMLKLSEGIDKLWIALPKNKSMESLIEQTFDIATKLYDLSKQVITLMDANEKGFGVIRYVSNSIIGESYDKWESAYEYLPFIKEKKRKYYESELEELNDGLNRTRQYFEKMKSEKEELIDSIHDEMTECETQLSSLGIFSFSSKKYCRERIAELQKEEDAAKKELELIINDYNNTISEQIAKVDFVKGKITWYSGT